ncbi:MAG: Uma2 family endonuclease [Ilumatobacteraceae bacterium]
MESRTRTPHRRASTPRLHADITRILYGPARERGLTVVAEINVGASFDFRVPDAAVVAERSDSVFFETALIVVEVLSPKDDTYRKFGFYHRHQVAEILVIDPMTDSVQWYHRGPQTYLPVAGSELLDFDDAAVAAELSWSPRSRR